MKLYICMTYYHTLISLIKTLIFGDKAVLLLANNIPDCKELKHRLQKTGCFESVYEYDEINILKEAVYNNKMIELFFQRSILKRTVEKYLSIDLHDGYDIYIYHDYSKLGKYLIQEKIYYHLIEDALDYFQYFDQYYHVNPSSYHNGNIKSWLKSKLNLGYQLWGTSPYCIDIEVNNKKGIKISSDKVIEVPRKELFARLTDEQKVFVYDTYASGKDMRGRMGKPVIVCTQPLYTAKHVPTMEDQIQVFEAVLKRFTDDGYQVVVKPHPRDEGNYSSLVSKYKCGFIDKNLPLEILNYNPEARYAAAVSITSTAINFLEYADKKIFMGMDYVEKVLKQK